MAHAVNQAGAVKGLLVQQLVEVGADLLLVAPVLDVGLDVLEHAHHLNVGAAMLGAL